jgi:hypothetical protein
MHACWPLPLHPSDFLGSGITASQFALPLQFAFKGALAYTLSIAAAAVRLTSYTDARRNGELAVTCAVDVAQASARAKQARVESIDGQTTFLASFKFKAGAAGFSSVVARVKVAGVVTTVANPPQRASPDGHVIEVDVLIGIILLSVGFIGLACWYGICGYGWQWQAAGAKEVALGDNPHTLGAGIAAGVVDDEAAASNSHI